jgi:hypothetical protein
MQYIQRTMILCMSQNSVSEDVLDVYNEWVANKTVLVSTYCQKRRTALAYHQPTPYFGNPVLVQLTGEGGRQKMTRRKNVV